VIGTVQAQLTSAVVAMLTHAAKVEAELVSVRSKSGHWAHWEAHPGETDWVDLAAGQRGGAT
jgi:hypothetical protein